MRNILTFAIDPETGQVWSRLGDQVAVPVLDYCGMTPANRYQMKYPLEKHPVHAVARHLGHLRWTKKIPKAIKNRHRRFWGMAPLR